MKFCDAHNDLWYISNGDFDYMKQYYNKSVLSAGGNKVLCAYYSKNEHQNAGIKEMVECFNKIRALGEKVVPTVENSWFLTPQNIDQFIELKPFCCTLTHNEENSLCGGALSNAGFTSWGRESVKILEENGIIIDTAHMNRKSFYEFVKITSKPIFNSHCGFTHFCNHPRNLTDEQIDIIVNSCGYIGLAFYGKFFGKQIMSKDLADAVLWLTEKYGYNTLGMGTDFNGMENKYIPCDLNEYCDLNILGKKLINLGLNRNDTGKFFNDNLEKVIKEKE